ncbi:MAG: hypothetical protein H7101_03465 [Deinococcales bacterium]|nr:hypothetical protein [Chitinophagaceae bacterium]
MRFIKLIGISIIILFGLVTALGLLFPAKVIVSRAVDISTSKDSILPLIKNFNGWQKWMDGMTENTVVVASPTNATLGKTAVTITAITSNKVAATWLDKNGNTQTSSINLFNDSTNIKTVVQWEFQQQLKWYPWERFASMMNDKILGTMMEKNLNNLKTILENK